MNIKRAIIVHCWGGSPEYCWYPYAKRELEKRGFEVTVPAMPDNDAPDLAKWLPKLKEVIGTPGLDLYLIGHSIGCATIMRYLESLAPGEQIGGVVFVAGFTDPLGYKEIETFFTTPINYKGSSGQSPEVFAERALLARTRAKARGIQPLLRRRSAQMNLRSFGSLASRNKKIRSHCPKFIAIQSDNDPYVPLKFADVLKKEFGAEIIVKHNMKHFSGPVDAEESCVELPDVVESATRFAQK